MWVPLHVHSQYSILDAAASCEKIAKKAAQYGMRACALTDHGNMYGAIDFYKACRSEKIKPILGCEMYVAPESRFEKKKAHLGNRTAYHLTLLATNQEGYQNLLKLSSLGFLEGFYYHPRIDKELLKQCKSGLICLSGCLSGSIACSALYGKKEDFLQEIHFFHDLFGENFYLELQRHTMKEENVRLFEESFLFVQYEEHIKKQNTVNQMLLDAGAKLGIKCVATGDSHYLDPEDWLAHEILLNIQSGEPVEIWEKEHKFRVPNPKRRTYPTRELYFKSIDEMAKLFQDIPEALSNTVEVADKCNVELDFNSKHYPLFIPSSFEGKTFTHDEQAKAAGEHMRVLCSQAVSRRYTESALQKVAEKYQGQDPLNVVHDRLRLELDTIISMGMCDYILIVADFINWAKNQGIPVGPGRGSGAGSIVCYLLGITDIEPLRFHLFFERFINPERLSYPDIDVDICMARRNEVIEYTVRKYGKENVAQIITFGTMKARMVIKDVGRVLSIPLSKVNSIAKLVPEDPNMTLAKALEIDPELHALYFQDPDAKKIIDLGKKLEGSIRSTGTHAAGVIISGDALVKHIPLCLAKDSDMPATQYSMKPVEAVGMLKIDFLGLKTLTCIRLAVDAIKEHTHQEIDWINLPLEDAATFHLLQQGKTLGVFQMESGGMQELAKDLKPDRFEEIIAIGALYRPGPMEMIPSFVDRKHGRERIEYDHPLMKPILAETYGIIVYQEQVMQIATQLAKYSLGEGDILRRAMGKKDAQQMAKEREKFCKGAAENGLQLELAGAIFDKVEKFASYGFNKSHAAAYGYLTYVTAYLKANYPKEWMAALMSCDKDDLTKVAKFIRECVAMGIPILPPDINEAGKDFLATKDGIRFAMGGIKGIGEGIVDLILQERRLRGPFTSFYQFFKRLDLKRIGKKTLEAFVDAGSFDFTGFSRDSMRAMIEEMFEFVTKEQQDAAKGILTFFSMMADEGERRFSKPFEVPQPTPKNDILKREKQLLGFFLTGHPLDQYRNDIARLGCLPFSELERLEVNSVVRVAAIIESAEIKIASKTQKKFAILRVGDGVESFEIPLWNNLYEEKSALCQENTLICAVFQIDKKQQERRLNCLWLDDLTKVDEAMIQACDRAYDQGKLKTERFSREQPKESVRPMQNTPFIIKANLKSLQMSHILKMKEILQQNPGNQSVVIEFHLEEKPISTLYVDAKLKVAPSDVLRAQLQQLQKDL